jgi:hypothetical protein
MKQKLLLSIGLLVLLAMPACAIPPFIPQTSHAVTVGTNGALVGSDTNFFKNNLLGLNAALLTPVVTTNYSYSTNYGYTVSGAGSSGINGNYLPSASLSFTNTANSSSLVWNSGGPYWQLQNGYPYYAAPGGTTNTAAGLTWQIVAGGSPAPTVVAAQFVTATAIGYSTNIPSINNASTHTNANASTFFSSGQIPPQFYFGFNGVVTNLASVPFAISQLLVTNSTTNFLVVTGMGAGNYYAANGVYYGTNGYYFAYNSAAGGIWLIANGAGCSASKMGSSSPIGTYPDNGCGSATVTQGSGTFTWTSLSNIVTVTSSTNFHYNITTYTNGTVATNVFQ